MREVMRQLRSYVESRNNEYSISFTLKEAEELLRYIYHLEVKNFELKKAVDKVNEKCKRCPSYINDVQNTVISSNSEVVVVGNEVTINGVKLPPCPAKGHNSTIIDNKVYLDGYEFVNGKWKRTLRSLWHKWF